MVLFFLCLVPAWLFCYGLWAFATISEKAMFDAFGNRALPALTQICMMERNGILVVPGLWLLAAIHYIIKGNASPVQLITFAATLVLALLCLLCFVILSHALVWLPIRIGIPSSG
jgi:hypothetical protein